MQRSHGRASSQRLHALAQFVHCEKKNMSTSPTGRRRTLSGAAKGQDSLRRPANQASFLSIQRITFYLISPVHMTPETTFRTTSTVKLTALATVGQDLPPIQGKLSCHKDTGTHHTGRCYHQHDAMRERPGRRGTLRTLCGETMTNGALLTAILTCFLFCFGGGCGAGTPVVYGYPWMAQGERLNESDEGYRTWIHTWRSRRHDIEHPRRRWRHHVDWRDGRRSSAIGSIGVVVRRVWRDRIRIERRIPRWRRWVVARIGHWRVVRHRGWWLGSLLWARRRR